MTVITMAIIGAIALVALIGIWMHCARPVSSELVLYATRDCAAALARQLNLEHVRLRANSEGARKDVERQYVDDCRRTHATGEFHRLGDLDFGSDHGIILTRGDKSTSTPPVSMDITAVYATTDIHYLVVFCDVHNNRDWLNTYGAVFEFRRDGPYCREVRLIGGTQDI